MNWKRWLGLLLVLALIVAGLILGFMPRAIPVETATVSRGPLQVTIREEGKTRAVDRFEISGS